MEAERPLGTPTFTWGRVLPMNVALILKGVTMIVDNGRR